MNPCTLWFVLAVVLCALGLQSRAADTVLLGDEALQLRLRCGDTSLLEQEWRSYGQHIRGLTGSGWRLETDKGVFSALDSEDVRITERNPRACAVEGRCAVGRWRLRYAVTGIGRITASLSLTPAMDLQIQRVQVWQGRSDTPPVVAATPLQDIAAFYRQSPVGLFVSLDFPFSRWRQQGGVMRVEYPPYVTVPAHSAWSSHTVTLGAVRLTGRSRYGYDDGEVDAMDAYIQQHVTPRFDRPMFVSACINNRFTQVQGDIVWYTYKDQPTLSHNIDLLRREIALMPELGMEYYQVWPGVFDSAPGDPDPATVRSLVAFGHRRGVRLGDYSGCNSLFCGHYNEHRNTLENHPEWGITSSDVCFGNPRFSTFYARMVSDNVRRYNFQIHCLDFLNLHPCSNPDHGHPPGDDSLYAQVVGLMHVLQALADTHPQMMVWSNSGNWTDLLPKIAWTNHNLYLTDPFIATAWQGLNMTRLLDDARREQMVSLHYTHFIPYRFLTNCQYFFSQNSVSPDIRNYQYGALSTLAVTPNLCLGEIRPWLDRLPEAEARRVKAFYKYWTTFLKRNYRYWTCTYSAADNPVPGGVEVYGHAIGGHGYVFVINPNYWDKTVKLPLNAALGLNGSGRCELRELYPTQRLMLTSHGPQPQYGDVLTVDVPAQQVLVYEVSPAPARVTQPRLYGLPGRISRTASGYLLKTYGLQGRTEPFALLLPDGAPPVRSAVARDFPPRQPKRLQVPTPVRLTSLTDRDVRGTVTFRRDAAPDTLPTWQVVADDLASGVQSGRMNGFADGVAIDLPVAGAEAPEALRCLGAPYIENAFQETQETWIDLHTGAAAAEIIQEASSSHTTEKASPSRLTGGGKGWWLQTEFHLPFLYTIGAEPFFDEHTLLVLPLMQRERVVTLRAWINGAPLDVQLYRYPRNRALGCHWADLVGSAAHGGLNRLVVYVESAP